MEEVKGDANSSSVTYKATYYTHQAIIIGCCMGEYSKPLLDARRVRNMLKKTY